MEHLNSQTGATYIHQPRAAYGQTHDGCTKQYGEVIVSASSDHETTVTTDLDANPDGRLGFINIIDEDGHEFSVSLEADDLLKLAAALIDAAHAIKTQQGGGA